jgi:outer membrane protein assembly factor BamB
MEPPLSGVYHGFVIVDNVLFVAGSDSDITAYSLESGEPLWVSTAVDLVAPQPGRACARPEWTLTRPQADTDNLYVASSDGHVYAMDLDSGERVWSRPLEKVGVTPPVLRDGLLYVCSLGRKLMALDAASGTVLWQVVIGEPVEYGQPALLGDTLYVSGRGGSVVAVDVVDHAVKWKERIGRRFRGDVDVEGGRVVAGDETGVHCLDASSGELLWSAPWQVDSPVLHDGVVYCLDRAGVFRLLDATSGDLIEEHPIQAGHLWTRPVLVGDRLLVAGTAEEGSSHLYCFGIGKREAEE